MQNRGLEALGDPGVDHEAALERFDAVHGARADVGELVLGRAIGEAVDDLAIGLDRRAAGAADARFVGDVGEAGAERGMQDPGGVCS